VYHMRNVLRAKVGILIFIQEHSIDVVHNIVDKFGRGERRDASRRSRTSNMVLVKGGGQTLLSGVGAAFFDVSPLDMHGRSEATLVTKPAF
jgi:hypothetical protein